MSRKISLTDQVHAHLREEILTGKLVCGSRHSIYELAEKLEVSRTPVRDAVLRLADAGMLTIERNRGVVIRGVEVRDVREVFEARLLLEVPAAAHAATHGTEEMLLDLEQKMQGLSEAVTEGDETDFMRRDRELHRSIILASGNHRLAQLVDSLRDVTQAHGVSTVDRSRSIKDVQVEHLPIVDAIRRRDAQSAADLMREHLIVTAEMLMRQVAESTGEAVPEVWDPFMSNNG